MFGHKVADNASSRVKKDSLAAVKSLNKKYARPYCNDYKGEKFLFATEAEALDFIARYSESMLAMNGYAPKRCYKCDACRGYHVTSQSLDGIHTKRGTVVKMSDGNFIQNLKSVHRTLNRIDLLITRANKAMAEFRLEDVRLLCGECVKLFESLNSRPGANLRRDRLMDKLKVCVNRWTAENDKLQLALFKVVFTPKKILTKQWYMQETVA